MDATSTTDPVRTCERCGQPALAHGLLQLPYCAGCAADLHADAEAADQAADRQRLLDAAGGPPRMLGWDFTTYPDDAMGQRAKAAGQAWLRGYLENDQRQNLLVHGPVGTGKSGLVWCMVRALCNQGVPARFVGWREYLDAQRDAMAAGGSLAPSVRYVPVLALDDLGAERTTAWALEQLSLLIEHRYQHHLPMLVTTNHRKQTLAKHLGDPLVAQRVLSRLLDGAQVVHLGGADRRDT